MKRTCRITNGPPAVPQRQGRPNYPRYYPSRKRRRRSKARLTAIGTK